MDVHQKHGNLAIILESGAIRLSVVCYLRTNIIKHSRDFTNLQCLQHLNELEFLLNK
jgi:hypothetical protein